MKRVLAIAVAVILPLVVLFAVFGVPVPGAEPALPSDGSAVLNGYLTFRSSQTFKRPALRRFVQAIRPTAFTAAMSGATYGDNPYYHTSFGSFSTPPRLAPATGMPAGAQSNSGSRPLPFPPVELWCAFLNSGDPTTPAVVFVGLHQDMYNAAWVVHEPTGAGPGELPAATLSAVGCQP